MGGQCEEDSRNQRKVHKGERTQEEKLIANPSNKNSIRLISRAGDVEQCSHTSLACSKPWVQSLVPIFLWQ